MTHLSIVIVSYNSKALLRDCLQSVLDTAADLSPETVVVDNASSDGNVSMMRKEFPMVRVIANSENLGFARATNQGIAAATGEYILLLNPDTRVLPGALAALTRFMDEHPEAGAVGPRLLNVDGTLQPSCHAFPNMRAHFLDISGICRRFTWTQRWRAGKMHDQPCAVDWVMGACLLLRRRAIQQVGPLDEDYFLYSEEMDWCYRARRLGWQTFFTPAADVIHVGGGSSDKVGRSIVLLYRSLFLFYRKHRSPWSLLILKILVVVLSLPRILVTLFRRGGLSHGRYLLQVYRHRMGP